MEEPHHADHIIVARSRAGKNKDYWIETTLEYKTPDGGRGWIVKVHSGPKPKTYQKS